MITNVFITIDTEFSIAGAFKDPVKNKPIGLPMVMCEKKGESHVLGFIIDTLDHYSLNVTFFVEALNVNYFGGDKMGQVAQMIKTRGGDVQLHIHPCWTYFKKRTGKNN